MLVGRRAPASPTCGASPRPCRTSTDSRSSRARRRHSRSRGGRCCASQRSSRARGGQASDRGRRPAGRSTPSRTSRGRRGGRLPGRRGRRGRGRLHVGLGGIKSRPHGAETRTRTPEWSYIVPLGRHRRPQRASELCLRGRDLPAPLPVLACHPSNRRAAAAKAHRASLCRIARCPTRRTVKRTRAVHRSLAHLLPKVRATARTPTPSQHAPLDPRPSTPLARRQRRRGHRRGLARRDDEAAVAAPRQNS